MKTKTIDLQGKAYAQVQDRLIEFRTANGNGMIETSFTLQPDGQIIFKARIVKDKSDANSAEATGHALGTNKAQKAFEKLETIAVGRALALLGYASSGEIASSEEMEEFEDWKKKQQDEMLLAATEKLQSCDSLEELKSVWADLPVEAKTALADLKEKQKGLLTPIPVKKKATKAINPVMSVEEVANLRERGDDSQGSPGV